MITRAEKDAVIKDLKEKIESSKALFLTNMIGIEANQAVEIRKKVREANGAIVVTIPIDPSLKIFSVKPQS